MMPLSRTLLSYGILLTCLNHANCFQGTPDPNQRFFGKSVREQESLEKFTIKDDLRFSPDIRRESDLGLPSLSESIGYGQDLKIPPRLAFVPRKLIGIDENPSEYWFDNKIHTFGNTRFFGGVHASVAPLVTRLIDDKAYDGMDIRSEIARDLYKAVNTTNAYVLDLCCGVGMSTRALASAFQDAEYICGVDTSPEMVDMAHFITKYNTVLSAIQNLFGNTESVFVSSFINLTMEIRNTLSSTVTTPKDVYAIGNAERVLAPKSKFDLVTLFFSLHEIPTSARGRIIREARRLLKPRGKLAIIDICPQEYVPSGPMLAGEPYVLEYQSNIERQIERFQGFSDVKVTNCIPGHVRMWLLTRK